jgi:hypothetical protein
MTQGLGANTFFFTSSRTELAASVQALSVYDNALVSFQKFSQDHSLESGPEFTAYRTGLSDFLNAVLAGDEIRSQARADLYTQKITPAAPPANVDPDAWPLTYTIDTKKLMPALDRLDAQFKKMNALFDRCVAVVAAKQNMPVLPPTIEDNGPTWSKVWEDEDLSARVRSNAKTFAVDVAQTVEHAAGGLALNVGAIAALGIGLYLLVRFKK